MKLDHLHQGFQTARRGFVAALVHLWDAGVLDEAIFTWGVEPRQPP